MKKIHKRGSTYMLMRVASDHVKPCLKAIGIDGQDEDRYIEVTQELYQRGVTCIADERTPVDKDGMTDPTYLSVGDIIVVKKNGVYCKSRAEFDKEYVIP